MVGDFQPNELHAWVKKYFGAIKKPSEKIPRVTAKEPPRKEDKVIVKYSSKAPLPAVAVTYLAPSVRSDDTPALALAAEILAGGESSRLYQSLVYEQQIAQQASFDADLNEDLGLLTVPHDSGQRQVTRRGGEGAWRATRQDFERWGDAGRIGKGEEPVFDREADPARDEQRQGERAGQAAVVYGDPNRVNTDLAKLQAVTAEQIKEVLNRYLCEQEESRDRVSAGSDETRGADQGG